MRLFSLTIAALLVAALVWNGTARMAAPAPPQYHTQTATLTTDVNTFVAERIFDLGAGPHPTQVTVTGLTLNGDGETFGNNAGTLYAGPIPTSSSDGANDYGTLNGRSDVSNFITDAGGNTFEVQTVNQPVAEICVSARYLKIKLEITSNDNGALYAGNNHPTAQVRVELEYL